MMEISKVQNLKPCGTTAAYQRHIQAGEKPCDPCAEAKSEYNREYQKKYNRVRVRAVRNSKAGRKGVAPGSPMRVEFQRPAGWGDGPWARLEMREDMVPLFSPTDVPKGSVT